MGHLSADKHTIYRRQDDLEKNIKSVSRGLRFKQGHKKIELAVPRGKEDGSTVNTIFQFCF